MRTIFHVGHAKTGTTALQATLEHSREALLRSGVLYPSNPHGQYRNHRLFFADLYKPEQVPRHILKNYAVEELPAARDELVASIRREIALHRPDCVVMSSESRFGVWSDEQRAGFLATLAEAGCLETEIVAYLRRPSSWYLSAVQQHLRASHEVKPPKMLRMADSVDQFVEDFGRERVHLRAFDRSVLVDGDVAADFVAAQLARHGVEPGALTRPSHDNHSLSAESFDLARRWRSAFHPGQQNQYFPASNALNRILALVEAEVAPPKPRIDPGLAELIDYCRDDVLLMRDRYGVEMPGYDYERVERGDMTRLPQEPLSIERIVTIDRSVQADIARRLRDTRWAANDPERIRWLDELPERVEAEERAKRRLALIDSRGPARDEAAVARRTALAMLWTPEPLPAGAGLATFGGSLAEAVGRAAGPAWIVEERAPAGLSEGRALRSGWGRHSARTGPLATAAEIERWTAWALGCAEPPAPETAAPETLAAMRRALEGARAVLVEPAGAGGGDVEAEAEAVVRATRRLVAANPRLRVLWAISPTLRGDRVAAFEAKAVLRVALGLAARREPAVGYVPTLEAGLGETDAEVPLGREVAALLAAPAGEAAPRLHAAAV
jgi:hypothetical protein